MIKSKKIRNVVAMTIGGLMASALVLTAAPVNAQAETTFEGCVNSGIGLSISRCKSTDVITFTDTDNCGFTSKQTGSAGISFGAYENYSLNYDLTFPTVGTHIVTGYKNGQSVGTFTVIVTDHTYDAGVITTQPTCVNDGVKTYTCTKCKNTYTEAVPKTGVHTFGDWVETTAPTVFEDGVNTRTCTVCGTQETEAIPKLEPTASFEKSKYIVKRKKTIKPVITLANGDSVKSYKAKNKKIVKVYKNGTIKGLKKGKTKVTATLASGITASYTVVVK